MHNHIIEQVLERLRSTADQKQPKPRRAVRLRGSTSYKCRETVEALAERLLEVLGVQEVSEPVAHPDPKAPVGDPLAATPPAVAMGDKDPGVPAESNEGGKRSERRPIITLKGNVAVSGRAGHTSMRQAFQVQVVKRRVPSPPEASPAKSADLGVQSAERRTYKEEIEALYWPSLSSGRPQAKSVVGIQVARSEPLRAAAHTPLQRNHQEHSQPLERPGPSVRVEPVAPPPAPEHRDGRIHFEYDDTVRKLAEPLRKDIEI